MQVGSIYKLHRKEAGKSIRDVASVVGLSASKLSDFENNKVQLKEEDVIRIYRCIQIEYEYHEDSEELMNGLFMDIFKYVCYQTDEEMQVYPEIVSKLDYVKCSSAYIVAKAAIFMYDIYHPVEHYHAEKELFSICEFMECLDDKKKAIFYDSVGCYYKGIYDWENAMKYFDLAMYYSTEEIIDAMVCYHKTLILKDCNRLSEALACALQAKTLFAKDLYQRREISVEVIIGTIYTRLRRFKEAEHIHLKCIKAREIDPFKDILVCHNNLIWHYVQAEEFEKAIEWGKIALLIGTSHHGAFHFFISYSYWRLKDHVLAKKHILDAIRYTSETTKYMYHMIFAFEALLSTSLSTRKKEVQLLKALEVAFEIHDVQLQMFVLKLLMTLHYNKEDYKKQIEYRNKLIYLLEKTC